MRRFLVIWQAPPMDLDLWESASHIWDELSHEFSEIRQLRAFVSLSSGKGISIMETAEPDIIHTLWDQFLTRMEDQGMPLDFAGAEIGLSIVPIDLEYEGRERIYDQITSAAA